MSPTHIAIAVTGLLLQLCLCQFKGGGTCRDDRRRECGGKAMMADNGYSYIEIITGLKEQQRKDLVRGVLTTAAHKPAHKPFPVATQAFTEVQK